MPRFAFALGLLALIPGQASAGLVTWEFAGVITSVDDPDGLVTGVVEVGSPFSGLFAFDSTTPDALPGSTSLGSYDDALTSIAGQIGKIAFAGGNPLPSIFFVVNNDAGLGEDGFSISTDNLVMPILGETADFILSLGDSTGAIFDDDSLPLVPPPFELFDSTNFAFSPQSELFRLRGEITSMALVPEPATLGLVALGALALVRRRRWGKSNHVAILLVAGLASVTGAAQLRADWTGGPVLIGGRVAQVL